MGGCCQRQAHIPISEEPDEAIPEGRNSPPPANSISNYVALEQWKRRVMLSDDHVIIVYDIDDKYDIFVNNLAYPPQSTAPFYISIIIRHINHYIDNISSSLLCKKDSQLLDGLKFTPPIITIHPICGKIYIADEYTVYCLDENDTENMDNNRLKPVAKIPNHYDLNHDVRITNISFNGDGQALFAMINNNLDKIYYIDLNTKTIFFDKIYDKSMDILRYNFNGYYLTSKWLPQFFLEVVNTIIPNKYRATEIEDAYNNQNSLYRLDSYRKYLWILQNNCIDKNNDDDDDEDDGNYNDEIIYKIEPILYRIPVEYANILKQLKQLNMDRILRSRTNDGLIDDSMEFAQKKQILENELEIQSKYGEIIKLNQLLKLEKNIYIIAFDIDRYYEAIYCITNNHILYRIERILKCKVNDTEIVRKKGKGHMTQISRQSLVKQKDFYENEFKINKGWQITHKLILNDCLSNGLPSGKCTICYDSVHGRIVVADNYKIQTLYI